MDPRKLYFAAGLLAAGVPTAVLQSIPDANARPMTMSRIVSKDLGAGAASTFETFLDGQMCSEVESVFGLNPNTCDVNVFKTGEPEITIKWVTARGKWAISVEPNRPGQWVDNNP